MHAFLIVGHGETDSEIARLSKKLAAKEYEFALSAIDDVRELGSFTRLEISEPTAIVIKNIQNASIPALHAFLKNLEEPQKDLYYILTTTSVHSLLPTIVSRCQIIKVKGQKPKGESDGASEFLKLETAERLAYLDKIRGRGDAIKFLEGLMLHLHDDLVTKDKNLKGVADTIKKATLTLKALKSNGNVRLQLAAFTISLKN